MPFRLRGGWKQLFQGIPQTLFRPVHRPEDALANDSLSVDQDPVRRAVGLVTEKRRVAVEEAKPAIKLFILGSTASPRSAASTGRATMRQMQEMPARLEAQRRQIKAEQAQLDADLKRLRQRSN